MVIGKLSTTSKRRWRIALLLMALFTLQSLLRLIGLSPPFQQLTLQIPFVHAIDLAAFACLALLLLHFAYQRKILQIVFALIFGAIWILLTIFDTGLLLAVWFHQRVAPLATIPMFYCNADTITACARPFPGITFGIAVFWLALSAMIFMAADAIAEQNRVFFKSWLRFVLAGFLILWSAVWIIAFSEVSFREPIVRFLGKTPPGPEPRALISVPRPDYKITPTAGAKPRLLVLIAIDSLRADAVDLSADKPSRTPFLQSLAASGKLHDFGPAVAICPTSYCGITGLLSSSDWATLQHGPPMMLPDVLAANNYTSHYLLSGPHIRVANLAKLYGPNVDTMLDDSSPDSSGLIDDREQVRRLQSLKLRDAAHSFIFIHLMSAHAAGMRFDKAADTNVILSNARYAGVYSEYYNRGVSQADLIVKQVVDVLKMRGILNDALIIITADHGERLSGITGHGGNIDLNTALIPLLVYDPRGGDWSMPRTGVASQFDAAPTLLAAIGVEVPPQWQGKPLQSGVLRSAAPTDSTGQSALVGRMDGQWAMLRCDLKNGRVKSLSNAALQSNGAQAKYREWAGGLSQRSDAAPCLRP